MIKFDRVPSAMVPTKIEKTSYSDKSSLDDSRGRSEMEFGELINFLDFQQLGNSIR